MASRSSRSASKRRRGGVAPNREGRQPLPPDGQQQVGAIPGAEPAPSQARLGAGKKALFAVATIAGFFAFLEAALAVAGVRPALYDADPYMGFASSIPLFVEEGGGDGPAYMTTAPNRLTWFNKQRFLADKPSGLHRIFSLGGSTTYGRPYDDAASFSGWLREFLPAADPSRRWEVINAGGISYASYRVASVMEELINYGPDLFVIYTGHNEFLERRSYEGLIEAPEAVTALGGWLSRTRIYAAGQDLVARFSDEPPSTQQKAVLAGEVDTILDRSVGPSEYTRDDDLRDQVFAHFRFNLNRMIDIARAADARVVLVTPAANLKDCSPFKSEHAAGLDASQTEQCNILLETGRTARTEKGLEAALAAFDEALAIDSRYAQLHYERGRVLHELGRFDEAKESFRRALEEDVCPLRAPAAVGEIVREVAAERKVPVLDFERIIEEASEHGISGAGLFLDHVHLSVQGYRLLALRLLDLLGNEGIAAISGAWNDGAVAQITERVESRIDERQHGVALRNLAKVYNWAGKFEESERLAAQANRILGEDAESYAILALRASERGEREEAIRLYRKALDLEPGYVEAHVSLAVLLTATGRLEEAVSHFREALALEPKYGLAHGGLGVALESQGKLNEAIGHYRQAVRLNPNNPEPHESLGAALAARGHFTEGINHLREALRLNPGYAEAHQSLGSALASRGEPEEAIAHFNQALKLRPDYPEAHSNLGSALGSLGRFDEAVEHLREALRLNPGYVDAHQNLGVAFAAQGNLDQALRHLREAQRLRPRDARNQYMTGIVLAQAGRSREALRHFRQAGALQPDWPLPVSQEAWILATHRDASLRSGPEALRLAQRAAEIGGSEDPLILDVLAAAYAETGQFDEAARVAARAIQIASAAGAQDLASEIDSRLQLYEQSRPHREPAP